MSNSQDKFHLSGTKMKFDLSKVEFSKNDIKLGIKLPEYLDEDLAYFLGFHVGDGYMQIKKRKTAIDYHLQYDGHQINEFLFYENYLIPLIHRLFNKKVTARKTTRGTVRVDFRSKAIVTFLNRCCGLSFSPKINITIPNTIKRSNNFLKSNFLRGLADTDFSLVFKKKGGYPVIDFATASEPPYTDLIILLKEKKFKFYNTVRETSRIGTKIFSHKIQINGKRQLNLWMEEIGFSSYNQLTKYQVWKSKGVLPPKTDITLRLKILKEKGIRFPIP